MSAWRVLIVEDDAASRDGLEALLAARGFEVRAVAGVEAAVSLIGGAEGADAMPELDAAFVDLGLPDGDGMDLIRPLASRPGACAVVVLTGERRLERAVEAMRRGAVDYLTKPLAPDALELALGRVTRVLDERDERRRLGRELMRQGRYEGIVGRSPPMRRVFEAIERCGPTDLPVLVRGESGTGKELVARALHQVSRRRRGPFVALNCGAIPRELAESELFGHERGAFTGATRAQAGAFERASGGTLFLDEITEMPLELQVVLLRALETGSVQRVGGARETSVDVRVVAATNRDPALAVQAGQMRKDLYFRLDVLPIALPPLRERDDDALLLAEHFREAQAGDHDVSFSRAARAALLRHAWPGNVRELRNVVQRAVVMRRGATIEPDDLGLDSGVVLEAAAPAGASASTPGGVLVPLDATLEDAERQLVLAQLERQRWNRGATAQALGIAPKTLYNKLRGWGVRGPGDAGPRDG